MSVPSGTVTFAFTDIEGSTQRWERDRAAMEAAVQRHDAAVRAAIEKHRGDAFKALRDDDFSAIGGLRVRAAIHTGDAQERGGDYFGPAVNRVARLLAVGHGGQVLVSEAAAVIAMPELSTGATLHDLGRHRLKDLNLPERIYELRAAHLPGDFPPLRSLEASAGNLPVQLTSFVGRQEEVAGVGRLLKDHRLVSIVGAGGVGKTRTALRTVRTSNRNAAIYDCGNALSRTSRA